MFKYIVLVLSCLALPVSAQVYQTNPNGTVSLFNQDGVYISTYQYVTNCLNGTCQQVLVPYQPQEYLYIAPEPRIQGTLPPTFYQPQYGPQGQNRTLEPNLSTPLVGNQQPHQNQMMPYGLNLPNSSFNVPYRPPAGFVGNTPQPDRDQDRDKSRNLRVR